MNIPEHYSITIYHKTPNNTYQRVIAVRAATNEDFANWISQAPTLNSREARKKIAEKYMKEPTPQVN